MLPAMMMMIDYHQECQLWDVSRTGSQRHRLRGWVLVAVVVVVVVAAAAAAAISQALCF